MNRKESLKRMMDQEKINDRIIRESELRHHGVKGMKWGVRRFQPYQPGDGQHGKGKVKGAASRVKQEVSSFKRELEAGKMGKNERLKSLSDDQLRAVTTRLRTENDLKRLSSKSKDKGDKSDYRLRASMSDTELKKRVDRLQLEDSLRQQAYMATKQQTDLAKKVINGATNAAVSSYSKGVDPSVIDMVGGAISSAMPMNETERQLQKVGKARADHLAKKTSKLEEEK